MANAAKVIAKIEVNASDIVGACIKALTEDGTLVAVVRCKDCMHYQGLAKCGLIGDCMGTDGFCSWGESRKDTET